MTTMNSKGCMIRNAQWTIQSTAHVVCRLTSTPPLAWLSMAIEATDTILGGDRQVDFIIMRTALLRLKYLWGFVDTFADWKRPEKLLQGFKRNHSKLIKDHFK